MKVKLIPEEDLQLQSTPFVILDMGFPERLAALRKMRGLTQRTLAEAVGVNDLQIRRYEAGNNQPTLEVIRKLAVALRVSSDALIFDQNERGPDDDLRLQFETISKFPPGEKNVVKSVLEGLILKHEARRWAAVND